MINTVSGYGSTGSICEDIAQELEHQGHECYIAYGQLTTHYQKSFKIGTVLENHLHNLGSRVLGKQGYFTKDGTKSLVKFIEKIDPDVIHLHNLHGNYLNLRILFEYLIKIQKPVIWTLHDCWAFTGKCTHYTDVKCTKWEVECFKCPQVKKYPPSLLFDKSKEMFIDKKNWFTSIKNMTIIPVSNWLAGEVRRSFLKKYPIKPIYNWVDHEIFKPNKISAVENTYNLENGRFTVLMVSAHWNKSEVRWKDLLKLASILPEKFQIIVVGKVQCPKLFPPNVIHIPYLKEKTELAKIYSFADVYVHLSTEDTFGKVIAEALSCGTPAVVYNSTACSEIVGKGCGYAVEKRNINEILGKIYEIKKNKKKYYSDTCREHAVQNFDSNINIKRTIDVYRGSLMQ